MAENLDLNIDNYNLDELLELFHLSYDFTENDLKQAKRIVLRTHPDKSGLPKEYFLFFSKAYKIVFNIYEFRHKSKNQSTEYVVEKNEEHEVMLKKLQKKIISINGLIKCLKNIRSQTIMSLAVMVTGLKVKKILIIDVYPTMRWVKFLKIKKRKFKV